MSQVGLIVPTLNAGSGWQAWLEALAQQTRRPDRLLLIDSSSSDETVQLAYDYGFEIKIIAKSQFNHGGTRQWGVEHLAEMDILVFLTQDAILADATAIEQLVDAFENTQVATAYGRQLPHKNAGPIAAHARLFNYPAASQLRGMEDRNRFGIKTAFTSNSFAAYRRGALMQVGGFPANTIMNEDTYVVGKMLRAGWKIAYCAEAQVYHSHDYGFAEEFKRYFDIGVFHSETAWLQQDFGGATGEGLRYIRSELFYLLKYAPSLIPFAWLRTGLKWLGYKLGVSYRRLPLAIQRGLSMHKGYWLEKPKQIFEVPEGLSSCE